MRHVRLTRLKKEILQPHPSPGHGERKRPPALSHTGNLGSSVHPPGPPGSRDSWEKNLRQRNESGQRPVISDTNRAKNEKMGRCLQLYPGPTRSYRKRVWTTAERPQP